MAEKLSLESIISISVLCCDGNPTAGDDDHGEKWERGNCSSESEFKGVIDEGGQG